MGIFTRLLEKLYRVAAKYRGASIVVGVGALTLLSLGISEPAVAQCSGPPGSTTCTPSGNPYSTGINVGNTGTPTTVTLEPNVVVNVTPGNGVNQAVAISTGTGPGSGLPATLTANNAAVTINTSGPLTSALFLHPILGSATITASGIMNVAGTTNTNAIWAATFSSVSGDSASVTYTGSATPGIIDINATGGSNSTIIQACANGGCGFTSTQDGNAIINATGNLKGAFGDSGFGLDAVAGGNGTATVNYNGGTINLTGGSFSDGIFATGGSATITTQPGTTIIVSSTGAAPTGVEAFAGSGAATATVASTITINGNPAVPTTNYKSNPTGIRAQSDLGGDVSVTSGPSTTVIGGGGLGIVAVSGSSDNTTASGRVTVNASGGPIIADGSNAVGILADSGFIRNVFSSGGRPPTTMTGLVDVTASNVSILGNFGTAISATGGSGGVTVNTSGSIMGGWQANVTSVGSVYGLPAAGVVLGSTGGGTATLTNNGSIGALSDRAVASPLPTFSANPVSPFPTSNNTSIVNNSDGTITGFVQLVGGNNSIRNDGTFNLRHFADTSGDGVRDTNRVAVADLGTGPNNSFTNNGTLKLVSLPVTPTPIIDSTGEYLPLGNPKNTMALGGPLQGQLIGTATFTNSGTIDLQVNPVPGDVLMITGGRGGSQPGISGGGTFISNGGSLMLDTVLNEGGAATHSDTLVVDGTAVGAGGATQTFIRNAGGAGALTEGDGILVVQVLDPARSADRAFSLAEGELRAGAFDYDLFHGGVGGSNPADWFLRSDIVVPPVIPPVIPPVTPPVTPPVVPPVVQPTPPPVVLPPETSLPITPPPEPLPPGVYPIIGPEIATYGVVQPLARQLGLTILGTLDDRVGDTYEPDGCAVAPAIAPVALPTRKPGPAPAPCPLFSPSVWGRFFGQTVDNRYQAFADPRANGNLGGFQGGIDLLRGSLIAGHYERAGLYGAFGDTDVNVDGLVTNPAGTAYILGHTGSLHLDAWSGGAYWTHIGPAGWYLDAVLQGTSYGGSASTNFARLDTNGWGFLASLEGGYPFAWPQLGPGFVIEPQGQIVWQKVSFGQRNDGLGDVALGDTTGTTGRIGLRTKWTIVTAGGQVWEPYLRANLWEDWGAQANTTYSGTDVAPLLARGTLLELGGGITAKLNANVSLFANADYEFAVSNTNGDKRNGARGTLGARYTW